MGDARVEERSCWEGELILAIERELEPYRRKPALQIEEERRLASVTAEEHAHMQELEATVKRLRRRIVLLKAALEDIADAREPITVLQSLARTVLRRQGAEDG